MKFALTLIIFTIGLTNIFAQESLKVDIVTTYYYRVKGKTATGKRTGKIKEPFIAISRDLLPKYPLNSYIRLTDCRWAGKYRVMDIMHKKYINTIDVYYKGRKKHDKTHCLCSSEK